MSCLSIVVLHPSSHKTPNDISGAVFIFGQMWICLSCLLRPGIWSFSVCDDSIVLPYGILAVVSFDIMAEVIVVVDCLDRCIFAPRSEISIKYLLVESGGVPILLIKIILGLLILILFIIAPNRHLRPFFPPLSFSCSRPPHYGQFYWLSRFYFRE